MRPARPSAGRWAAKNITITAAITAVPPRISGRNSTALPPATSMVTIIARPNSVKTSWAAISVVRSTTNEA